MSSINRLIRGTDQRVDDGRKDYSIHGILGGKSFTTVLIFVIDIVIVVAGIRCGCVCTALLAEDTLPDPIAIRSHNPSEWIKSDPNFPFTFVCVSQPANVATDNQPLNGIDV